MKQFMTSLLVSSVMGFSVAAFAAPVNLLNGGPQTDPMQTTSLVPRVSAPINLLAAVKCQASESRKVCEVRAAAARRAAEVIALETAAPYAVKTSPPPYGLLIPAGLVPVNAIECPPHITVEECARMNGRLPETPPRPLDPPAVPPPVVPQAPPPVTVPEPATPPIAADPESVIQPPRTGDDDLVKRPPLTNSQMPVVKPKPNPPVIP